jgi:hypothetical protein
LNLPTEYYAATYELMSCAGDCGQSEASWPATLFHVRCVCDLQKKICVIVCIITAVVIVLLIIGLAIGLSVRK